MFLVNSKARFSLSASATLNIIKPLPNKQIVYVKLRMIYVNKSRSTLCGATSGRVLEQSKFWGCFSSCSKAFRYLVVASDPVPKLIKKSCSAPAPALGLFRTVQSFVLRCHYSLPTALSTKINFKINFAQKYSKQNIGVAEFLIGWEYHKSHAIM